MTTLLQIVFLVRLTTQIIFLEIPAKNKEVIAYVEQNGHSISPSYQAAVCTELVIGVLKHFMRLTKEDKIKIRIISGKSVEALRKEKSPMLKGVYYALTTNGKGKAIERLEEVLPGDFVQFWTSTWGHCGIVKQMDLEHNTMLLYSSFPTTNGYGVQSFGIPDECYFVRLK